MNRPSFFDLSDTEQINYGNGCGLYERFLNVPDFAFEASCRHHDFNYSRGVGADKWWQNLYRWPFFYCKANWDFVYYMFKDATAWWHYLVAIVYFMGVMIGSWPWFSGGPWKSVSDLLEEDSQRKVAL